jgi:hypothetical protein
MCSTKRAFSIGLYIALSTLTSCSTDSNKSDTNKVKDATISWSACEGEDAPDAPFECSNLEVPLDYKKPDGTKITIALIRIPADKEFDYQGILLTNPGGPGGSGFDFLVSSGEELLNEVGIYS